ncbi:MAG: hypothetical protein JSW70_08625 [Syntrophobacterales bacterium]|nr:MAG: hypothetical protein JSW70_08625 [Syntrophobacterales bacterium]
MIHELKIEVAGHPISLKLEGNTFLHSIKEVYHQFLSDKTPEFRLRVYPDKSLMIHDESSVGLTLSDEELRIVDDYLMGFANLRTNEGEIRINPIWFIPSLATFVRNLFTLILLLKDNGIALHALGVLRNGEVFVFWGPSGSGKTTVARLSPGHIILSDDIVFIKPLGQSYGIFPTPRWGDMQWGNRENRPYPLKLMFKLVKDREAYLKSYGITQGISEIFTIPHIPQNSLPFEDLLNRYYRLLKEVPCFEMHFTKDGQFWEAIERECVNLASKEG